MNDPVGIYIVMSIIASKVLIYYYLFILIYIDFKKVLTKSFKIKIKTFC